MAETTAQLRVTKEVLATQKGVFEKIWMDLPQIVFTHAWKNGTGYLDHAVDGTVEIDDGSYSFTDDYSRRGILFIDGVNRVVVFERYAPDADDERSINLVQNASDEFEAFAKNNLKEECYPFKNSLIGYNDGDTKTRFERLIRFVDGHDRYDAYC